MRVKMLFHIGGTRDGQPWPPVGGVMEVSDREAASLVANKYAIAYVEPVIETAEVKPLEKAARTTKPQPRRSLTKADFLPEGND